MEIKESEEIISLSEFLENVPPNQLVKINDLCKYVNEYGTGKILMLEPDIQLHCPEDTCNGTRFLRSTNRYPIKLESKDFEFIYITYICSNCQKFQKTFSLAIKKNDDKQSGECYKFGELPPYGPPTPPRLITLIGPDREIFLKGRRCENQGLGIGAFIYYRRVVENQKNRILEQILKVSEKIGVEKSSIEILKKAIAETQFSSSLDMVKNALPQALLINGYNPMSLLHSALSSGVHEKTDQECLEIASSIRIVLAELSERLSQALKDEVEIKNAITLLNKK